MSTPLLHRSRAAAVALLLSGAPAALPPVLAAAGMMAPVAADARPGLGGSMGSRGSRTYSAPPATSTSPYGAAPINRSMTPSGGQYGSPYAGGGYGGGYAPARRSHPFAAGLAGGLLGAGIGGLLFGHRDAYADGYGGHRSGFGNILWTLIELAVLFFVGRWLFRRFFRRGPAGMQAAPMAAGARGFGGGSSGAIQIGNADYQAFERALLDIQQAWTMQDLRSLGRFATPEMVGYFSEQLSDLTSRNLRNAVSAVRMEHGDLSEAWSENGRDFATVAMRYSMIDVTTDLTGRVVDGSPNERQTVTELWTFVRAQRNGSWVLSAIQQSR